MTHRSRSSRLRRLERQAAQRVALPLPAVYWSELHQSWMQSVGGIHVPAPVSSEEWAERAAAHQAHLSIPEDRADVRHGRPQARPVRPAAGAPVQVVGADGSVSSVGRVDAMEMIAGGEWRLAEPDGATPAG